MQRNRNHMQATTATTEAGAAVTFKHRNTLGGHKRMVEQVADWLGFTADPAGPSFGWTETTTAADEALGLTVGVAALGDRNTGETVSVELRTSWVTR